MTWGTLGMLAMLAMLIYLTKEDEQILLLRNTNIADMTSSAYAL